MMEEKKDALVKETVSRMEAAPAALPAAPRIKGAGVCDARDLDAIVNELGARPPGKSTGLRSLDRLLSGGLRSKSFIACAGAAKAGKTTYVAGFALDAACEAVDAADGGAFVCVLSAEMHREELFSRWLAREAMRLRVAEGHEADPRGWLGASAILYGKAQRGECGEAAVATLGAALARLRPALERCYTRRLPPAATPLDVREFVQACAKNHPGALPIVVVDPIQRLYAAPDPGSGGKISDAANREETERMGLVAQQFVEIIDVEGWALLVTSDGTKATARGASSATSLRGSYVLNHAATTILGVHTSNNAARLAARICGEDSNNGDAPCEMKVEEAIARLEAVRPDWLVHGADFAPEKLGSGFAYVDCSGNRHGPKEGLFLATVPGAGAFVESDDPAPFSPPPVTGRKGSKR